jgi:hypothetical protein
VLLFHLISVYRSVVRGSDGAVCLAGDRAHDKRHTDRRGAAMVRCEEQTRAKSATQTIVVLALLMFCI